MKLSEMGFKKEDKDLIQHMCITFSAQYLVIADGDFNSEWWKNK